MNTIFELTYPEELTRHPFQKRTYQRNKIVERTYSNKIQSCWHIINKDGCKEYRSDFEPQSINFHNLSWFVIDDEFYCFSRDWKEVHLLDDDLNKKKSFVVENPIFNQFNELHAGHTSVKNEIPFLFGHLRNELTFYFSVLKFDFEKQTCKWLFQAEREWLLSTYWERENPKTEIVNIDEKNYIYPLRTYFKSTLIDDLIWNGKRFTLKIYNTLKYHTQRPTYSLVEVDEHGEFIYYGKITEEPLCYSYSNKVLYMPQSFKDHLCLMNNNLVLGTPNSFYDNTKAKYRKSNNQYLWDIHKKEFIKIPLPKEYNEFYVHFIELNNFMTISKFDKEKNESLIINLDLKI